MINQLKCDDQTLKVNIRGTAYSDYRNWQQNNCEHVDMTVITTYLYLTHVYWQLYMDLTITYIYWAHVH